MPRRPRGRPAHATTKLICRHCTRPGYSVGGTLAIMFWAAMLFVPIIIGYTTWTYAKMWRRVTVEEIKSQEHLAY